MVPVAAPFLEPQALFMVCPEEPQALFVVCPEEPQALVIVAWAAVRATVAARAMMVCSA